MAVVRVGDRPVLTLAALEAHDPYAPAGGRERRFLCPFCGQDKRQDALHRSLSLNIQSGLWHCHRCDASGQLQEHWRKGISSHQLARVRLKAKLSLSPVAAPAAATDPAPILARATALADTSAAVYLERRGIPLAVAEASGVLFCHDFYGRSAVLFPMIDRHGSAVAVNGRYLDAGAPKTRTAGPKSLGMFCTPGSLDDYLVICEAPIDALSLAAIGIPAVALVGTSGPDWLRLKAGLRHVALALDADEAGDQAAVKLKADLTSFGAKCQRWRPDKGKDWNEILQESGLQGLRESVGHAILHARESR